MKTTVKFLRELAAKYKEAYRFGDFPDSISAKFDAAILVAERFAERAQQIDREMMPDARWGAKEQAARGALAEVEKLFGESQKGLKQYEDQILTKMREAVAPKPRSSDVGERIERALLRQEVRAATAGLSNIARADFYRKLPNSLREAMTEVPVISIKDGFAKVEPFVSDEVVEEVLLEAGAKALPEESRTLEKLRTHGELYRLMRGSVQKSITDIAPVKSEAIIVGNEAVAEWATHR